MQQQKTTDNYLINRTKILLIIKIENTFYATFLADDKSKERIVKYTNKNTRASCNHKKSA